MNPGARDPVGALGRWLPPLLVLVLILATLPFGPHVAAALGRLSPPETLDRIGVGGAVTDLLPARDGVVAHLGDGRLVLVPNDAGRPRPLPVGPCRAAAIDGARVACASGAGVVVLDADTGAVTDAAGPTDATALAWQPDGLVIGTARGELRVGDATLTVGDAPILVARPMGAFVIAGDAAGALSYTRTFPGEAPAAAGRVAVGGPVRALATNGTTAWVAAGPAGVVLVDQSDLDAPRATERIDVGGEVTGVVFSDPFVYAIGPEIGAVPIHPLPVGRRVGGASGVERQAIDVVGPPPSQWFAVGDAVIRADTRPTRDDAVLGVGALGLLLVASVVGGLVRRRPPGWPVAFGWAAVALIALGALLRERLHLPIEALHVLEYGAFGLLAYRALLPRGAGASTAALALLLGLFAGLLDETVQWWIPNRTGALDDVTLDAEAAAIGALVGWKVTWFDAPRGGRWSPVAALAAAAVIALAAFQHVTVGFGHDLVLDPATRLRSRLTLAENEAAAAGAAAARDVLSRSASWGYAEFLEAHPPHREPWLHELRVHVYRRDRYWGKDDLVVACGEQRIIDRLYADALVGTPYAFPDAARARCAAVRDPYTSPVSEDLVTFTGPAGWWAGAGALAAALLAAAAGSRRRGR